MNLNEPCQHGTVFGWEDKWRLRELFQSGLRFESSLWLLGFRPFRKRISESYHSHTGSLTPSVSVEVEKNGGISEVRGQGKGGMERGLRF